MPPQRHLPRSSEPKVRQRSSKACAPCRKRKIKCDGALPCAACTGYGYECIYTEIKTQKKIATTESSPAQIGSSVASDAVGALPSAAGGEDKLDSQFVASESFVEDAAPLRSRELWASVLGYKHRLGFNLLAGIQA